MTRQHARKWFEDYVESVVENVVNNIPVDPRVTSDDLVAKLIEEYNRPELPAEPDNRTILNGAGHVWERDDRSAEDSSHDDGEHWYATGDPNPYTWSDALDEGADPARVLVDRQTLIDEVLAARLPSNEFMSIRLFGEDNDTGYVHALEFIEALRKRAGVVE